MASKADFTKSKGRPAPPAPVQTAQGLPDLVHEYLEEVEIAGRSAVTARRYHDYLATFLKWLATTRVRDESTLRANDLDAETIRQYRLYLARRRDPRNGRVIGAATRNLYQIALRNFLRYCRRRRLAVPEPDETLQLAKERDIEIRHLERGEVVRIASAIRLDQPTGLRDRAIVEALFGTGVRVSELVGLTIRQVNLERREAEVVGKGGKSRLVLLTTAAAGWLKRYLVSREDGSSHLFVSNRKDDEGTLRPLSVRQVQHVVEGAARRAGIPFRVSPHWFRHSRLTVLARHAGVQAAQRIAGHASLATTARYLHVSDEHLRRAFDEAERADETT